MNPWLETGCFVLLIGGSVVLAQRLGRHSPRNVIIAYLLAFIGLLVVIATGIYPELRFTTPFSWMTPSWVRYLILAVAAPIFILTPAAKLARRSSRIFLHLFVGVFLLQFVVLPIFLPALVQPELLGLKTRMDPDGVCTQQTSYTCGPAAAVTALRKLGLPADEGDIAIWSGTSRLGTSAEEMAAALQTHYAKQGITVRYIRADHIADVKGHGQFLAVMKYDLLTDHFVAVLEATDHTVVIGDPLNGKVTLPLEQFEQDWRHYGLAIEKNPPTAH